jgi:hypothetical protein
MPAPQRRSGAIYANEVTEQNLPLLRGPGFVLSSFPRSGSIWLRMMLYDCAALSMGRNLDRIQPADLDWFSPPVSRKQLPGYLQRGDFPWRVFKAHLSYEEMGPAAADKKYVVLFRDPADAFTSDFRRHEVDVTDRPAFDRTVERKIENWLVHSQSYLAAAGREPERFHFVSYEDLHADTVGRLARVVSFLGVEAHPEWLPDVVANRTFDAMVTGYLERRGNRDNLGKGRVGTAAELIPADLLGLIRERTGTAYRAMSEHH